MKNELVGKFETFVIMLLIVVGAFAVRMYKIGNPIADWHSWRQADTASVSYLYVRDGINILYPRYFDISAIQTGYTNLQGWRFVEFPIFNVLHAQAYKYIGHLSFDEWGRMISIICSVITVIMMYFLGKKLADKWVGLLAAFFYAFIPFNIYFTRVVLPEPMAVMFSVSGVLFFLHFYEKSRKIPLFLSATSFALALLLKPFAAFYALPLIYLIFKKYSLRKIFQNIPLLLALDITLLPFFAWRGWVDWNAHLVGVPFFAWMFNGDAIRFRPSFWRWIFGERIGFMILGMWGLPAFFVGVLTAIKKNKVIAFLLLGMFLYLAVVATANVRHDYYQTFIIPAIALTLAYGFVETLKSQIFPTLYTFVFLVFSIGMMFLLGWDKIKGDYQINRYAIVTAGQEADKILPKDAIVIAPYDADTAFLYQTKRFGWPVVDRSIEELIELGAQYYISVNFDADTNNFMKRFKAVEKNDQFVILDLQSPVTEK